MLIAFLWKELVIGMQVELIVKVEQGMTFKCVGEQNSLVSWVQIPIHGSIGNGQDL
jgi:hypothetical protein